MVPNGESESGPELQWPVNCAMLNRTPQYYRGLHNTTHSYTTQQRTTLHSPTQHHTLLHCATRYGMQTQTEPDGHECQWAENDKSMEYQTQHISFRIIPKIVFYVTSKYCQHNWLSFVLHTMPQDSGCSGRLLAIDYNGSSLYSQRFPLEFLI